MSLKSESFLRKNVCELKAAISISDTKWLLQNEFVNYQVDFNPEFLKSAEMDISYRSSSFNIYDSQVKGFSFLSIINTGLSKIAKYRYNCQKEVTLIWIL